MNDENNFKTKATLKKILLEMNVTEFVVKKWFPGLN